MKITEPAVDIRACSTRVKPEIFLSVTIREANILEDIADDIKNALESLEMNLFVGPFKNAYRG